MATERERMQENIEVLRDELKKQQESNRLLKFQLDKLNNQYKYAKMVVLSYKNTLSVAEDFLEKNKLLEQWIVKRNNETVEKEGN